MRTDALRDAFLIFAERECRGVSPLYEALARGVAGDARLLALADEAGPGQPRPNMLLGAVHALLIAREQKPVLAAHYPDLSPDHRPGSDAFADFRAFCQAEEDALRRILQRRVVSTNEPARAACLLPAFCRVAARFGAALHLVEVGASAGLLLRWDRYAYDYGGGLRIGTDGSTLVLHCAARGPAGPPLPKRFPTVASRIGIDLHPLDPGDAADTTWLRALVWPEQTERAAVLEAALALARQHPVEIRKGDGTAVLAALDRELPRGGTLCVFHAFTLNQFPAAARQEFLACLDRIGADRPTIRIGLEWEDAPAPLLRLQHHGRQPAGPEVLAACDAHGAWIEWRGA